MKKTKLVFWAIADALGIFVYVSLVAFIMFDGQALFGKVDNFTGPMMVLLLFVVSAVITGTLFLGRPVYLFLNNFKKEGIQLFFYTLASLVTITLVFFIIKIL